MHGNYSMILSWGLFQCHMTNADKNPCLLRPYGLSNGSWLQALSSRSNQRTPIFLAIKFLFFIWKTSILWDHFHICTRSPVPSKAHGLSLSDPDRKQKKSSLTRHRSAPPLFPSLRSCFCLDFKLHGDNTLSGDITTMQEMSLNNAVGPITICGL